MDEGDALTFDLIRNYLVQNNGKVSNHELVKHFKSYLTHPNRERQEEAKLLFRDTINTLATLKQENGVKCVVLRKKYRSTTAIGTSHLSSPSHSVQTPYRAAVWPQGKYSSYEASSPSLETSHSYPNITSLESGFHPASRSIVESCSSSEIHNAPISSSLEDIPQAPPRRRVGSKGKEGLGTRIEEKLRELNKENDIKIIQKDTSLCEAVVSPGIVKERKEKLNKIASESDVRSKSPLSVSISSIGKGNFKLGKDDDDTASVASLSPYRREWTIKAAKGDYNSLVRLLKEEPKLANFKDFVSGFTALHWAAKLGNSDIVKLIAGKHHGNPNARSHGGYTPLHVAAMFKRLDIMELLNVTYGANPGIRDYSGKKAEDYLPKTPTINEKSDAKTYHVRTNSIVFRNTELSLTRMGSLNFKVKKTVHAVRGSSRVKSWGSSEQLSEMISSHFVPIAKSSSAKKKKSKQSAEEKKCAQDSDSDSAYGFYS